jgi:hypothetical protein
MSNHSPEANTGYALAYIIFYARKMPPLTGLFPIFAVFSTNISPHDGACTRAAELSASSFERRRRDIFVVKKQ